MIELDAHEAALAKRLNVSLAPYHPPSEKFYHSNYVFDGCLAANLRSSHGYFRSAARQLLSFKATQRPNGMVPGVSHPPKAFFINPERWLSTAPFEGNDYTQTPDWARSVLYLYDHATSVPAASPSQSIKPDEFVRQIYPFLGQYYGYFINFRQIAADDPRAFLLHPNESNRDSGPENDEWKQAELERQLRKPAARLLQRKPRQGERMPTWFNYYNRTVDYLGAIAINIAGFKAGWDPARIRETTGEFVDVWFNSHLCENYSAMSQLATLIGAEEDACFYSELVQKLELAMDTHYDEAAHGGMGSFYSTYNGRFQRKDTIGNLASLLLPNAPVHHIESNLDIMDEFFDTPFVLPCISTADKDNWDPNYEEPNLHWHNGTVWGVANVVARRGLLKVIKRPEALAEDLRDRARTWEHRILDSSVKMVEVTGDYAEHQHPYTGLGQRMHKTRGHVFGIPLLDP